MYTGSEINSSPNSREVHTTKKGVVTFDDQVWTEEEDRIILEAADVDALQQIEERHGDGSVRKRHVDLMDAEF